MQRNHVLPQADQRNFEVPFKVIPKPHFPLRPRRKLNPLSPVGLALVSYGLFVVATIIPPSAYESIMQEPNAIFLNPVAYLFVTACVLSFAVGAHMAKKIKLVRRRPRRPFISRSMIIIPVVLASLINLLSLSIFLKKNPDMLLAWLLNAAAFKKEMDATGALTEALPLLFAVSWWSFWRLLERESVTRRKEWTLRFVVGIAFMFAVATSILKVARYDLLPGIFGFLLIYAIFKFRDKSISVSKYIFAIFRVGIFFSGVFVVFSYLRGAETFSELVNSFLGYTLASYNRLAFVLSGDLKFPYAGTGTYAFRFLSHIPLLHNWIDIGSALGMPSSVTVWQSEFPAVSAAGLDGAYIWISSFGYLYLDIGIFCFLYFLIIGMLMAFFWKSLIDGRPSGVILYPWFAFSVIFWFGSNFLAYPRLITLLVTALLFSIYEMLKPKNGNLR